MSVRRTAGRALGIALTTVVLSAPSGARADRIDGMLTSQAFDASAETPELTIVAADAEAPGGVCEYTLKGTAGVSRSSGASSMRETGSARARTSCARNVTATLAITDAAPSSTRKVECRAFDYRTATCGAQQYVAYFGSDGAPTRPLATVTFRYTVRSGGAERLCMEHVFVIVAGAPSAAHLQPCNELVAA